MSTTTALLAYRPDAMTPARLAAVSYLARYTGHTHALYAFSCVAGSRGVRATAWTRWSGSSEPTWSCTSGSCQSGPTTIVESTTVLLLIKIPRHELVEDDTVVVYVTADCRSVHHDGGRQVAGAGA